MKKTTLLKTMLLLCALIVGSSSAWAVSKPWSGSDPASTLDLATISSSTMGKWNGETSWYLDDDYLVVTGYESYKSVANQTWITESSVGNSSTTWEASYPFKGSSYYTNANYATIQSGRYLLYKVTNLKSLKIYGKNNAVTKYLDIFIYTKSGDNNYTKVEEIKYTGDKNVHIWENSETLSTSETYYIYITGVGNSNSQVYEVAFERNVSAKHTLSFAVSPSNTGTVTLGATSVAEGQSTTITATPNEGYRFVNWTVTGTGAFVASATSASTTFTMGTADATVTANFEAIPSHTLSYVVDPAEAGTVTLGATSVLEGASTTISATANAGFEFVGWEVSGEEASLEDEYDASTTFTMGTADATVTAYFSAVTTHEIKWSVNGTIVKTENVKEGNAITFAAPESGIPNGYVYKGWVVEENIIDTPTDTDPAANYVTAATSIADITYYCVMAREINNSDNVTLTASFSSSEADTNYSDHEYTDDHGNTWKGTNAQHYDDTNNVARFGMNSTSGKFESPEFPSNITAIKMTVYNGSGKNRTFTFYSKSDKTGALGSIAVSSNTKDYPEITATLNGTNFKKFYIGASDALGFSKIQVTYGTITTFGYCTSIPPVAITITAAGWASFSNASEVEIREGVTAYYAQKKDDTTVTLKEISGGYIPANTGVVLSGVAKDYSATVTTTSATLDEDNLLMPWLTAGEPTETTYYTLAVDSNNKPVFKQSTGGTLAAGKAYLVMPAGARELTVSFDEEGNTTSIDVRSKMDDVSGEVYNLNGQRVAQPTKGLYIVNGKKVVVK